MNFSENKIAVVGGDSRMLYAANCFAKSGAECAVYANNAVFAENAEYTKAMTLSDALAKCQIVLLPIPLSKDGYSLNAPFCENKLFFRDIINEIPSSSTVCAGIVGSIFDDCAFSVLDYGSDELFCTQNARYTVEGALSIATEKSNRAICGSCCSVFGFGRIGKYLALALKALGANVTVFARDAKDRAFTEYCGYNFAPYTETENILCDCDFLFNTVPDKQICEHFQYTKPDTPIIELAGVSKSHDNIIYAPSLPALYSPKSAGTLIYQTVRRCLFEKGQVK